MMKKIPILIEEWKPMWQVYPKSSHSFTKCADLSQKFALFAQSHIPCKLMQRFISTEEILLCLLYKTFSTMMENFENFYKLSPIHSNRSNGHGLSVRQWQDLVWHFYWPEKLNFSVKCVLIHDISHSEKSYNILPCQKFKLLTLSNLMNTPNCFQPFFILATDLVIFHVFSLLISTTHFGIFRTTHLSRKKKIRVWRKFCHPASYQKFNFKCWRHIHQRISFAKKVLFEPKTWF